MSGGSGQTRDKIVHPCVLLRLPKGVRGNKNGDVKVSSHLRMCTIDVILPVGR